MRREAALILNVVNIESQKAWNPSADGIKRDRELRVVDRLTCDVVDQDFLRQLRVM